MEQKEVWNNIAQDWHVFRNKTPKEVEEFLKDKKGKILDLGCGSGRNFLKNPSQELYAVDFSEEMLKFARANAEKLGINANIILQDTTKLNFKDNFFDAAIFISTLHCMEPSEARKKALEELFRVLKPNAEAMISVWKKEKNKTFKNLEEKEGYTSWKGRGKEYERYYYFYDDEELENLLKEAGFKILKIEYQTEEKHSKKNLIVYVKK